MAIVRPRRRAAERTNAAIDASVRELAGVSPLGIGYPPYPDSCESGQRVGHELPARSVVVTD
eukprot:scaffold6854_cov28-Phaeocystis_antarctica.AAC.1